MGRVAEVVVWWVALTGCYTAALGAFTVPEFAVAVGAGLLCAVLSGNGGALLAARQRRAGLAAGRAAHRPRAGLRPAARRGAGHRPICRAALIRARWLRACGTLPSAVRSLTPISSLITPTSLAR